MDDPIDKAAFAHFGGAAGAGPEAPRSAVRGGVHGPRPLDRAPEPWGVDGVWAWGAGAHAAGVALSGA